MAKDLLTKDDLLFLKRAEGLALFFDKIGKAKQLIAEAQDDMRRVARMMDRSPPKAKSNKVLRRPKTSVEYGVDLPDALSNGERKVYAELQKAGTDGRTPRELVTALKLSLAQIGRATRSLKKRKLVESTGATVSLRWRVR